MRECGAALDISQRVDSISGSFQPIVHLNESTIVGFHASGGKIQSVRIWDASGSNQQMRANKRSSIGSGLNLQLNLVSQLIDARSLSTEHDLHAILPQNLRHFFRDVGVFARQQLAGRLNDRHPTAETAEELSKLKPNVSTAKNEKVIRNRTKFHDRFVIEEPNAIEPFQLRPRGAGAGVDEQAIRGNGALSCILRSNLESLWPSETCLAHDQLEILGLRNAPFGPTSETRYDVPLALPNLLKVNGDGPRMHAVVGRTPRQIRHSSTRHHGLRRRASFID